MDESQNLLELVNEEKTTLAHLLAHETKAEFEEAVHGYINWLAAKVIENGIHNLFPLMDVYQQLDVAIKEITGSYKVGEPILLFTISKLNRIKKLPLVGTLENGMIIPDTEALEAWQKEMA